MQSKTRQELLNNTVAFYNLDNRAVDECGGCQYYTEDGNRCAIGRELSVEDAMELENKYGGSAVTSNQVYSALPQRLKDMGSIFLNSIQSLHDDEGYWSLDGISEDGVAKVQRICSKFDLELPPTIKE